MDPYKQHDCVRRLYNWHDVAIRTEKVYQHVKNETEIGLHGRIQRYETDVLSVNYFFLENQIYND